MNTLDFIAGLMRQNYDAVGWLTYEAVREYLDDGDYYLQMRRGKPIGYLLHGKLKAGRILTVAQVCLEYDFRSQGFGTDIAMRLIERANQSNCRSIVLPCAEDLMANAYWQAMGFEHTSTELRANKRQRRINIYTLDLWPTLFNRKA